MILLFLEISSSGGKLPEVAPHGAGRIWFLLIQTLPTFLVRMDLDFEDFLFFFFLDTAFLDLQVHRSPNSQISRFPDFRTTPAPPDPDEFSDPNLTLSQHTQGSNTLQGALAATEVVFAIALLHLFLLC